MRRHRAQRSKRQTVIATARAIEVAVARRRRTASSELIAEVVVFLLQTLDALAHVSGVRLGVADVVHAWKERQHRRVRPLATRFDSHRLRISHLLVLGCLSGGRTSSNSSNMTFMSLRRLRSAILCDSRSSGERLYPACPAERTASRADFGKVLRARRLGSLLLPLGDED